MSQAAEPSHLCRSSPSAFDTVETRFFSEGDELSTATPGDAWDDPTASVRMPKGRRMRLWLGCAVVGAALGLAAVGATSVHARRASTRPAPAAAAPFPAVATVVPPRAPEPPAAAPIAPGLEPVTSTALHECQAAFERRARKAVLALCSRAFAEQPQSPAIAVAAVMLAQTELDRGRFRPALDWAKKALALDADQADAYVFLGGAEQALGRSAAAKSAYHRYLALAPRGRYAGDVRAVVGSL